MSIRFQLVVQYVSSPYYHSYDCYSSSDCGIFWYVISYHWWPWLPLWWGFLQCWVSMMWFCHHPWHQDALEVVLVMPLCHSSNLPSFDASSGLCQLHHGFSTDMFLFRVEPPTILYIICLVSVLVSAFYFQVPCWIPYSPLRAQILGFAPLQPLGVYPWQAYVQPGDGHWPTAGMHKVAATSTTLSRGSLMLLSLLFPSHPICMMGHTVLGAWQRVTWSLCSLHGGRGVFFSRFGSIQWHSQLWICDGY